MHVVEKLQPLFKETVLYFYNPNIHPTQEYEKRLSAIKNIAELYALKIIGEEYDHAKWHKYIKGYENEKEGGARCPLCYRIRLAETAKKAKELGFDYFATTLSISPHKKAVIINEIGREEAKKYNLEFLEDDFKKQDGFKKTNELAKKYNIYRQNYCGCLFSLRDRG